MATMTPTLRPLSCWKSIIRHSRQYKASTRSLTTYHQSKPASQIPLLPSASLAPKAHGMCIYDVPRTQTNISPVTKTIKTFPPPSSPASIHREPIKELTAEQILLLDPTGARTQLFSKTNPESAKVGDILLVRLKTGDPFAGVCINIRRRGVDTGILLRNELTRVGVEMWYKIYSPNVEGIEVVQRAKKRARRARLTYMRKPKHDMGSVQNIVMAYQRAKSAIRGGGEEHRGSASKKKKSKGKKAKAKN